MSRPTFPAVTCLVCASTCIGAGIPAASVHAAEGHCPYLRMHAAESGLVTAVNAVVQSDIPIAAAMSAGCTEPKLPAARAALLALVPDEHAELIAVCAKGKTIIKRNVKGFDLLGLLDEDPEPSAEASAVRQFFDERSVDIAYGRALSSGPYPISFDWAIVLDAQADTLYSFILNCGD